MLLGLTIRDVVLIERLSLQFERGLVALTGETGAGKSILLDALGLALGQRAEARLVRTGADTASVSATFAPAPDHPALAVLAEQGLAATAEEDGQIVLRRTLAADGRSRAFVNDEAVSVGLLRQLGQTLVEIHGQFDTQGLLNPHSHREVLDAFGGLEPLRTRVEGTWAEHRRAAEALDEARTASANATREQDDLTHALDELRLLDPRAGEEEALATRRQAMMHRERILEAMTGALAALDGDDGADRAVARAQKLLDRVAEPGGPRVAEVLAGLDRAAAELSEAIGSLQAALADTDLDPAEQERLEERLFALRALARKHDCSVDDLPDLRVRLEESLARIARRDEILHELDATARAARARYAEAAAALSEARREAAGLLDASVAAELPPLKLEKARFVTALVPLEDAEWGPAGRERVAFEVATNPGEAPGPINRIASGGELARFMLAIKVVLAASGTVPTLIFDEVDSGISGATADAVGERLARLARESAQVLVVTHSPQVAARATHHLRVAKAEAAGRTTTSVTPLAAAERREEIARMLSGASVTDQARAAADSLIAGRRAG